MEPTAELVTMKGRTVLVTGASSGIGKAIAARFADAGADLLLADINREGLEKTVAGLREAYAAHIQGFVLDLERRSEIAAMWEKLDRLPDTVVNNAGIYPMKNYLEVDEAFLATTMDVNLTSVFWLCQGFIGRRKGLGGNIINVSSIEAILPFKRDMAHYSMSKAAVIALTRSLARDYGKDGFRVNVIVPGAIRTPSTSHLVRRAICRVDLALAKTGYDFQSRLTLGRWGRPDEVARVALFLASPLASYVHGAVIPVDGGFLSS